MTTTRSFMAWTGTALCALALLGCSGDDGQATTGESASESGDGDGDETGTETGGEDPETATITHRFGEQVLAPFEEIEPCVQWTLDNDEAIYIQAVTLSNLGYFHHSNWFVVPEDLFAGPDGYFDCGERGFSEIGAASQGTVLFAQSTQSFVEEQRTGPGAVVKIPPRYKVVAGTHMLNVGPAEVTTDLFMTLELIHPRDVEIALVPFRLSYYDLDIPPTAQSRFTGNCANFGADYESSADVAMNMKLHYVLPHYHYLGDYFDLSFIGGALDGSSAHSISGFDGEAHGKTFDPPLDMSGVTGLRFTCGFDNWRDVNVGWGIGDQEMCVMLGLAESEILMDISVNGGTVAMGQTDGVLEFESPDCDFLGVDKNSEQTLPTDAEREGPFYVPPSGDEGIPPVPACVDHDPGVAPSLAPTLDNVFAAVFQPSCMFNACHGVSGQAAGLNLQAVDLHAELLGHEVLADPGASLIEPGDPDSSWLYRIMADCEPQAAGGPVAHMPRNAPILLDDEAVALVREWIAAGAMP